MAIRGVVVAVVIGGRYGCSEFPDGGLTSNGSIRSCDERVDRDFLLPPLLNSLSLARCTHSNKSGSSTSWPVLKSSRSHA